VRGPDGPYRLTAAIPRGCDGGYSRVRDLAGIPFPGITYPEVNRLGQFSMPDSVTLLDDGDYELPGLGRVRAGFTQTERGVFAIASYTPADLGVFTSEDEEREYDDDTPMTVTELQDSIRRVLGANVPLGEPTRVCRASPFTPGMPNGTATGGSYWPAMRLISSPPLAWQSAQACSTRSTLPGSWPPTFGGWAPAACWTPIMTNATSPANVRCYTPKPRWR